MISHKGYVAFSVEMLTLATRRFKILQVSVFFHIEGIFKTLL